MINKRNSIAFLGILFLCSAAKGENFYDDIMNLFIPPKEINQRSVRNGNPKEIELTKYSPFFNDVPFDILKPLEDPFMERKTINNDIPNTVKTNELEKADDKKQKKKLSKNNKVLSFFKFFVPSSNNKNRFEQEGGFSLFNDLTRHLPFDNEIVNIFDNFKKLESKKKIPEKIVYGTKKMLPFKFFDDFEPSMNNSSKKNDVYINSFNPFDKVLPEVFLILSSRIDRGNNNSKQICCVQGKNKCQEGGQCKDPTNEKHFTLPNEEYRKEYSNRLNNIDKTFLFCVMPGILGLAAVVTGIEIIRRHNQMVKKARIFNYDQVQHC